MISVEVNLLWILQLLENVERHLHDCGLTARTGELDLRRALSFGSEHVGRGVRAERRFDGIVDLELAPLSASNHDALESGDGGARSVDVFPGASYLLAGNLLYVLGTFAVTMMFNVPLNNDLAAVDPESAEGGRVWSRYLRLWTFWNHVRAFGASAAAASLMMAFHFG